MTQYDTLSSDLDTHYNKFQLLIKKYDSIEKSNKDLLDLISNLKYINNSSKENERKCNQQLELVRNICNNQENTISQLYLYEDKNKTLLQENASLQETIRNLNTKINEIEVLRETTVLNQNSKHLEELENNKEIAEKQAQDLLNQLELVQASADLQINDLQTEMNSLTNTYEAQLKKANDTELQLNSQISMLNNHMSSSIGVYQKKIFEIEQKVKMLEKEKATYLATKGNFVSAQNIFNMGAHKAVNQTDIRNNITKKMSICLEETNNVRTDTIKRFKFRKNNENVDSNSFVDEHTKLGELLLKPNDKPNVTKNHFAQNFVNKDSNLKLNSLHTNFLKPKITKQNIETNSPSHDIQIITNKKRKLYDPNNYDYLPNVD